MEAEHLERFSPVLLQNILMALKRFEPDLYAHLSRQYHLDAERMLGLFSEVDLSGPGQLLPLLADLRSHQSYHDIVYLAGRNAMHAEAQRLGLRLARGGRDTTRFQALLKQLLPSFMGQASYSMLVRGEMHFIELRDSVFAREVWHHNPVCGFYSGLLAELGTSCVEGAATAQEVRCTASDAEASSCMFRVSL
jgi:predicted hydrocarbon binding protein